MSKNPPQAAQEQGFLSHLVELRDCLLRIVLAVGIVFLVLMPFAQKLYALLAAPLTRYIPEQISTGIVNTFLVPYKLALLLAFVLALPYVLYQLWRFVAPGLYQHEKRLAIPMLVSAVLLFYLGMAFAYFIVLPMMFSVLPAFAPTNVTVMPDIADYLDFVMMMFLAFGFCFEMPIATILLINSGMVAREDLVKSRPYVIVAAFVVGMLLTPPDVLSQVMLAIPMWFLFEVGLVASKFFDKRIKESAVQKQEMEAADRAAQDTEYAAERASSTTAASLRAGDDVESPLAWEDERYSFRETETKLPETKQTEPDYRPLTPEEMDAEMARIDAEQAAVDEQARLAAQTPDKRSTTTDTDKTP